MRFLTSFGMTAVLTEKAVVIPSPAGARNLIMLAYPLNCPQKVCMFSQLLIKYASLI